MQKREQNHSQPPLALGVVGCGRVFELYHLPALRQSNVWTLAALCDALPERRSWLQSVVPRAAIYDSYAQFLRQPGLDAVLITTPPATHAPLAIQALEAGLPVLVEKPMALTVAEAEQMAACVQRVQKPLWIGFTRRFRQPYRQLRHLLSTISTEKIRAIQCSMAFDAARWNAVTGYLGYANQGGAVIDDVASHQLDLLTWLFRQPVIAVRVQVQNGSPANPVAVRIDAKLANHLTAQCVAGHQGAYTELLEIQLDVQRWTVHPAGLIQSRHMPASLVRRIGRLSSQWHLSFHKLIGAPNVTLQSFARQLDAFAIAVRSGENREEAADAASGVRLQHILHACRESLQQGGTWFNVQ